MAHDLVDNLESRLRAARPRAAEVDATAFDAELLARLRDQPIAARRIAARSLAVPVAAGVTLTATAVVMLSGGPGDVGGLSSAAAITQSLRWLNPPPGTILHVRSVETVGTQTTTRELWQSADHPDSEREVIEGAHSFETSGAAIYDPAANTIYDGGAAVANGADGAGAEATRAGAKATRAGAKATRAGAKATGAGAKVAVPGTPSKGGARGDNAMPAGDPIVAKVRILLQQGRAVVAGRAIHNGTDAWAISLRPDAGRPVWTLWVSAADGKPLELRDPGRDGSEQPQVVRWATYQVLPNSDASQLLTLQGAHPSARVVHDPAQTAAADRRLWEFSVALTAGGTGLRGTRTPRR